MNKINAEIIADSINPIGDRITTFKLTYPRIIHSEMMTHRAFSRNSASSRAIPFEKMLKMVQEEPFIPIAWQKDHKGMQGSDYTEDPAAINMRNQQWLYAKDRAVESAKALSADILWQTNTPLPGGEGVTKQLCNRLLEPFMYHTVIVTATDYDNFFELRCPKYYHYLGKGSEQRYRSKKDAVKHWESVKDSLVDFDKVKNWTQIDWLKMNDGQAEIHIMDLAEKMWDCYNESTPTQLKAGQWHIPYGDQIDIEKVINYFDSIGVAVRDNNDYSNVFVKIATARCARLSYQTLGDNPKIDYAKDIDLHDNLLKMKHLSPMEHCAKVPDEGTWHNIYSRNFKGFIQYRALVDM